MLHTEFQASKPSGSEEKDFLIFFMYFYGSNLQLVARDHLGPWDLLCNKIGKGPLGNAINQLSSI